MGPNQKENIVEEVRGNSLRKGKNDFFHWSRAEYISI
jgi:hypothetical protein